jgi:hypothetical protein
MLMRLSGSLMMTVTQNEAHNFTNDMLLLEPMCPWKPHEVNLDDEWCSSTEVPGMDPFKLSGVMCGKMGPYNNEVTMGIMANGNIVSEDPVLREVLYVPDAIKNKDVGGRIMITEVPQVLEAAFRMDASYGKALSSGLIGAQAAAADTYSPILEKFCKAAYMTSVRSMVRGRAMMALRFRDFNGSMILPGRGCRFTSNGKTIYHGYIQSVTHAMSTSGGCGTAVAMSHMRPSAEYAIGGVTVFGPTDKNPAYEKET